MCMQNSFLILFLFVFYSILFRPSGEHVQAADMGRVMGTLMSDQIFASVAYSGLVTYPHFSISFLTIEFWKPYMLQMVVFLTLSSVDPREGSKFNSTDCLFFFLLFL